MSPFNQDAAFASKRKLENVSNRSDSANLHKRGRFDQHAARNGSADIQEQREALPMASARAR